MARRRRRNERTRRVLGAATILGLAISIVAGVIAIRDNLNQERVVLDVDDAKGSTPDTVPVDASTFVREAPRSIEIGELELVNAVRPIGIEDTGELEIPDETEVGWYQYGSAPGLPGATVLAAHVSWNRSIGPFHRLGDLEPGARVDVVEADGSTRVYAVVERAMYDKDELPIERIWRTTGDEALVLITCGGDYNPNIRRYRQNIVVYAVPIADLDAPDDTVAEA